MRAACGVRAGCHQRRLPVTVRSSPSKHDVTRRQPLARARAAPASSDAASLHDADRANLARQVEVVQGLENHVVDAMLPRVGDLNSCWQPADLFPPSEAPDFIEQLERLRTEAAALEQPVVDAVVALLVSKEMVPAFLSQLNTLRGAQDETGASALPWAQWNRAWAAHENRHCDVLKRWLYLSGRADVRAVEVHVHALMQAGLDTGAEGLPYAGLISAAFQERWHSRAFYALSKAAEAGGCPTLAKACRAISEDEKRQEVALSSAVTRLFEADPEGAVIAMARAHQDGRLGALGSLRAAQRTIEAPTSGAGAGAVARSLEWIRGAWGALEGIEGLQGDVEDVRAFIEAWGVPVRAVSSTQAAAAQDYLLEVDSEW
ncbi:unnamed protein product [Pedinophyceae sp. YPF-701]|nr:unnamed protein product [Pedinophyceae sp. YPF-701]